jgi:hypothetical protein
VRAVDGTFVPWSFVARAPAEGLAVTLENHNDVSYLVSSHRAAYVVTTDKVIDDCRDGLVVVAHNLCLLSFVMLGHRHSSSAGRNGPFPFAKPNLSGNSSARCHGHDIVRMIVRSLLVPRRFVWT